MRNRDLLRDILNQPAESSHTDVPDFEAAVFRKTVGTARRVRRVRIMTRVAAVLLVGALALFQFKRGNDSGDTVVATGPSVEAEQNHSSYTALRSERFAGVLRTEQTAFPILLSHSDAVTVLRTGEAGAGEVNFLTDDELLSFFPGQALALVKHGPQNAELLFLDHK